MADARSKIEIKLDAISNVDIDDKGRFKYILIKVHDPSDDSIGKCIVRGFKRADYHADILEEVQPGIDALGLATVCLGGGRIEHTPKENKLLVYGYSMGFGRADHKEAVKILQQEYPDYSITYSNEGY